jgi:hypothetical protein
LDDDNGGEVALRKLPDVTYTPVASNVQNKEQLSQDLVDDYEFSRTILRGLITRGTSALEGAMTVAAETEHPRAFETAANIMKSVAEMTKDLMSMHTAIKPKQTNVIDKQINVQNNFTGSGDAPGQAKTISSMLDDLED